MSIILKLKPRDDKQANGLNWSYDFDAVSAKWISQMDFDPDIWV